MADEPKRFTREDLEVAIMDAAMSGRVYAAGGEKETPAEFHGFAIKHAMQAVAMNRARERRLRAETGEGNV